jgi:hypothetical protein
LKGRYKMEEDRKEGMGTFLEEPDEEISEDLT